MSVANREFLQFYDENNKIFCFRVSSKNRALTSLNNFKKTIKIKAAFYVVRSRFGGVVIINEKLF